MDETTIRLVKAYGLDREAHRREAERCRYARIQDNSTDLLSHKEEICARVGQGGWRTAKKRFAKEYEKSEIKNQKPITRHYRDSVMGWPYTITTNPPTEEEFVDKKMKEEGYHARSIDYLLRFLPHKKLVNPTIRRKIVGTLANLYCEARARNLNLGGYNEIFNALSEEISEYSAEELMKKWTQDERRRIEDSWDI